MGLSCAFWEQIPIWIETGLAYKSDKLVVLSGVAVRVCPVTKQGNLQ